MFSKDERTFHSFVSYECLINIREYVNMRGVMSFLRETEEMTHSLRMLLGWSHALYFCSNCASNTSNILPQLTCETVQINQTLKKRKHLHLLEFYIAVLMHYDKLCSFVEFKTSLVYYGLPKPMGRWFITWYITVASTNVKMCYNVG